MRSQTRMTTYLVTIPFLPDVQFDDNDIITLAHEPCARQSVLQMTLFPEDLQGKWMPKHILYSRFVVRQQAIYLMEIYLKYWWRSLQKGLTTFCIYIYIFNMHIIHEQVTGCMIM